MSSKAIICGQLHGSLHVYSYVGGLVQGSSGGVWLVDIVAPSVGLETPSVPSVPSSEPLRRQLYPASVSKHLLAFTIVSGFGYCIWDGSPSGAVSAPHCKTKDTINRTKWQPTH